METYPKIAEAIGTSANEILFLSDIKEELEAADAAGFQTVQLVRPGTEANWPRAVKDFTEIVINH
jgi:enolase-phosphatase E1